MKKWLLLGGSVLHSTCFVNMPSCWALGGRLYLKVHSVSLDTLIFLSACWVEKNCSIHKEVENKDSLTFTHVLLVTPIKVGLPLMDMASGKKCFLFIKMFILWQIKAKGLHNLDIITGPTVNRNIARALIMLKWLAHSWS